MRAFFASVCSSATPTSLGTAGRRREPQTSELVLGPCPGYPGASTLSSWSPLAGLCWHPSGAHSHLFGGRENRVCAHSAGLGGAERSRKQRLRMAGGF